MKTLAALHVSTNKAMLCMQYYICTVPCSSWVELDGTANRVTGKWRLEGDEITFEVEHGSWEPIGIFFGKKWVTHTKWYGEASVRFVQEFDCKRGVK